jgi:hypothetical protein
MGDNFNMEITLTLSGNEKMKLVKTVTVERFERYYWDYPTPVTVNVYENGSWSYQNRLDAKLDFDDCDSCVVDQIRKIETETAFNAELRDCAKLS